jgi:hypothetical protein
MSFIKIILNYVKWIDQGSCSLVTFSINGVENSCCNNKEVLSLDY